jgi:hypothetical protein
MNDEAPMHSREGSAVAAPEQWEIVVRGPGGRRYEARTVVEDIEYPDAFREHLLKIARKEDSMNTDSGENWIGEFELEVYRPGQGHAPDSYEAEKVFRWRHEGG